MPERSSQIGSLPGELNELRDSCITIEKEFSAAIAEACPQSGHSVRNLLDYLALRRHDLRDLQSRLTALGLSSLGRSESNTLAALENVIAAAEALAGSGFNPRAHAHGAPAEGAAILEVHANDLLGAAPKGRAVRIMVTMASEAAESYDFVRSLIEAGMDVMRVNCAHDSERAWGMMIEHMRRANRETGRQCQALMDLAGPKLRTGQIPHGHHVARWKARKNTIGATIAPARIALTGKGEAAAAGLRAEVSLPAPDTLVRTARIGDVFRIRDSRGKKRKLVVSEKAGHACLCLCRKSGRVIGGAGLKLMREGKAIESGYIGQMPFVEEPIRLRPRDLLLVTKEGSSAAGRRAGLPQISCTLPEVFTTAQPGQPIFFDDGKIEGRIRETHPDHLLVEIAHAAPGGTKLGSAKGINLPETDLGIGAMTEKDRKDLDFVAAHADIVGLSFVRRPEDVLELQRELAARGRSGLGIILKIESRPGFDRLPLIMLAAMRHHPVGIMVARGDLAIEIGFERLAEVQEEILWLSEAAHMPVIWATQVLETLAKTGTPSRAEVTDAAMGVRAECVMLNKGEHIVEAVRFLDHVLHRMQAHQLKKRSMLRKLHVAPVEHPAPVG